ncbi:MAG: hypothetical protein CSA20_00130 [Deltaproteobacteria bacterium]|nr:MAG: hypothetical protein CSA20_00130 [Deltaproteobacteria bacterium]
MKNLSLFCSIILVIISLYGTSCFAEKNAAGKDKEVIATYFQVVELILTNQFEELQQLLDGFAISQSMTADGKRHLEEIYSSLLAMDPEILEKWVKNAPESPHPFIVRGKYFLKQTKDQLRNRGIDGFTAPSHETKRLLRRAQADLEKAHSLDPKNPAAPGELVAVAMYRGYPAHVMNRWFDTAVEADPAWLAPYENKLRYLSSQQHGSAHQQYNFAMACATKAPKNSTSYSILFLYYDMLRKENNEAQLDAEAADLFLATVAHFKADFPYTFVPHYYEALFKSRHGAPQEAEYILSTILKIEPKNIRVITARLQLALDRGHWQKASTDCMTLKALQPELPLSKSCEAIIENGLQGLDRIPQK